MCAPEAAVRSLTRLRELGVRTAIDDFGTGYSSLAWLSRLPLDVLKVHGSFLQESEEGGVSIVRAVLSFAEAFGLDVVMEGVETDDQRARVAAVGVMRAQGWAIARPVPEAELAGAVGS
jgi:EAL domain-containing protein (putative c-di-GMP-specific phosphodiesterase class I)